MSFDTHLPGSDLVDLPGHIRRIDKGQCLPGCCGQIAMGYLEVWIGLCLFGNRYINAPVPCVPPAVQHIFFKGFPGLDMCQIKTLPFDLDDIQKKGNTYG